MDELQRKDDEQYPSLRPIRPLYAARALRGSCYHQSSNHSTVNLDCDARIGKLDELGCLVAYDHGQCLDLGI